MDYDLENWGGYNRVSFNAVVPDKDQVEYYWPAWRAAFQGAHIQSSMCSVSARTHAARWCVIVRGCRRTYNHPLTDTPPSCPCPSCPHAACAAVQRG